MTTKEIIILKLLGLGTAVLYGWSMLWISLMYLYGGLYVPLRELGLRKSIYFESFVIILTLIIFGIVFFKSKGRTFLKLLIQDIILIIVSVPFFGLIFGWFHIGFDDQDSFPLSYGAMFLMTILIINLNDWSKTKAYR